MRLIDADALIGKDVGIAWVSTEAIRNASTIDAVPVVRCRECKYRDGTPGQPNIQCGQMHEDDFCSYGERKEGAD